MSIEILESAGKLARMAIKNGNQRDAAIKRAEAAEAALAERDKPCVWTRGYDKEIDIRSFECGCTQDWYGNAPAFCPNCGHPVEVAA